MHANHNNRASRPPPSPSCSRALIQCIFCRREPGCWWLCTCLCGIYGCDCHPNGDHERMRFNPACAYYTHTVILRLILMFVYIFAPPPAFLVFIGEDSGARPAFECVIAWNVTQLVYHGVFALALYQSCQQDQPVQLYDDCLFPPMEGRLPAGKDLGCICLVDLGFLTTICTFHIAFLITDNRNESIWAAIIFYMVMVLGSSVCAACVDCYRAEYRRLETQENASSVQMSSDNTTVVVDGPNPLIAHKSERVSVDVPDASAPPHEMERAEGQAS